jgi:Winged helix DNA-binding domain
VSTRLPTSRTNVAQRRLAAQHLAAPTLESPADVVRRLGAVQAQDYGGAKWALAMRTRGGADDSVVEQAFSDGSILRTHLLRPTWHFVAPADIRWMLALTAPRISAAMAHYNKKLELDTTVFRRSNRALFNALRDGKQMTRRELGAVLRRARINVDGTQRLAHLMMQAELDTVVCSGARRDKQFTYALLDERVPPTPPLDRDEALLELTRRYFATRSPATPHDFAWWSGLTVADATKGIRLAGTALEREVIDDRTYWFDRSADVRASAKSKAFLLPNYDEFFIGFKDRSAIAHRLRSTDLVTGGDAVTANVIIVDGQLVGGWKRTVTKDAVVVDLKLLVRLTKAEQRAVHSAVESYGNFLGLRAELTGDAS